MTMIERLIRCWDFLVYRLAYKSLHRLMTGNAGFAYLFELHLRGWRERQPLPDMLMKATETFYHALARTAAGPALKEKPMDPLAAPPAINASAECWSDLHHRALTITQAMPAAERAELQALIYRLTEMGASWKEAVSELRLLRAEVTRQGQTTTARRLAP